MRTMLAFFNSLNFIIDMLFEAYSEDKFIGK